MYKTGLEAIADWAGLTAQLDVPLRSYSSGMVARLAFATATDETPDLLLIDEVLSVGDEDFREKSAKRTQEYDEWRMRGSPGLT
jgi:ABC-type polysaccharide/polyol phosphate transport system ATPase subunit